MKFLLISLFAGTLLQVILTAPISNNFSDDELDWDDSDDNYTHECIGIHCYFYGAHGGTKDENLDQTIQEKEDLDHIEDVKMDDIESGDDYLSSDYEDVDDGDDGDDDDDDDDDDGSDRSDDEGLYGDEDFYSDEEDDVNNNGEDDDYHAVNHEEKDEIKASKYGEVDHVKDNLEPQDAENIETEDEESDDDSDEYSEEESDSDYEEEEEGEEEEGEGEKESLKYEDNKVDDVVKHEGKVDPPKYGQINSVEDQPEPENPKEELKNTEQSDDYMSDDNDDDDEYHDDDNDDVDDIGNENTNEEVEESVDIGHEDKKLEEVVNHEGKDEVTHTKYGEVDQAELEPEDTKEELKDIKAEEKESGVDNVENELEHEESSDAEFSESEDDDGVDDAEPSEESKIEDGEEEDDEDEEVELEDSTEGNNGETEPLESPGNETVESEEEENLKNQEGETGEKKESVEKDDVQTEELELPETNSNNIIGKTEGEKIEDDTQNISSDSNDLKLTSPSVDPQEALTIKEKDLNNETSTGTDPSFTNKPDSAQPFDTEVTNAEVTPQGKTQEAPTTSEKLLMQPENIIPSQNGVQSQSPEINKPPVPSSVTKPTTPITPKPQPSLALLKSLSSMLENTPKPPNSTTTNTVRLSSWMAPSSLRIPSTQNFVYPMQPTQPILRTSFDGLWTKPISSLNPSSNIELQPNATPTDAQVTSEQQNKSEPTSPVFDTLSSKPWRQFIRPYNRNLIDEGNASNTSSESIAAQPQPQPQPSDKISPAPAADDSSIPRWRKTLLERRSRLTSSPSSFNWPSSSGSGRWLS